MFCDKSGFFDHAVSAEAMCFAVLVDTNSPTVSVSRDVPNAAFRPTFGAFSISIVLTLRGKSKVVKVDATGVPANVINLHPIWDRPIGALPSVTVGIHGL